MTDPEGPSIKLKICLAGEAAVGKTSLIRRFVEDVYEDRYVATLGAKVTKKELQGTMPDSGERIRIVLTIWDILGEAGFRDFVKDSYFRGSQGILAVCDLTRPLTLFQLEGWKHSIWSTAGKIPAYVLGNKVDLVDETRLGVKDIEAFCEGWGCPYSLTSAKTGTGVEEAFRRLTSLILKAELQDSEVAAPRTTA